MTSILTQKKSPLWYLTKFSIILLILAFIFIFKARFGYETTQMKVNRGRATVGMSQNLLREPHMKSSAKAWGRRAEIVDEFALMERRKRRRQKKVALMHSDAQSGGSWAALPSHAASATNLILGESSSSWTTRRKLLSMAPPQFNASFTDLLPLNEDIRVGDDDDDDGDDGNTAICHRLPLYPYDKCQYAKDNCMSPLAGGILNYLQIRYCTLTWWPIFYVLMAVWLFVLFFLLGDTAEAYFCPSLTEISRLLRLSPDVSGVTLLAFGNGAPDIASIIAGVIGGSAGFGLGEPIGAGLFVTTAVFAAVALLSNVKVDAVPFIRDVGTCLIGVVFCFVVFLTGKFELWQSLTCLGLYVGYVSFVVIGEQLYRLLRRVQFWFRQRDSEDEEKVSLLGPAATATYGDQSQDVHRGHWNPDMVPIFDQPVSRATHMDPNFVEEHRGGPFYASHYYPKIGIAFKTSRDSDLQVVHVDEIQEAASAAKHSINDEELQPDVVETHIADDSEESGEELIAEKADELDAFYNDESDDKSSLKKRRTGTLIIEDHFSPHDRIPNDDEEDDEHMFLMKIVHGFKDWIDWDEMSTIDRIQFILASPFTLVRNLTIPKADKEEWSKFFAVLSPVFIPWFTLWAIGYPMFMVGPIPLGAILTVIGIVFAIGIFFTSQSRKTPVYHSVLVLLSFFMGIIWIYILANELVDVLQTIGILWQVSDAILAVTVLTWGNSLGDMVSDVVVARSGFPDMACAAIFGGPTLNLLIGIGLSVTYHCISEGHSFPLDQEPTVFLSFVMLILSLVSSLVVVPLSGFRAPNIYGVLLLCIYVFFMVVAVCMELGFLW
eukprot:CAMPEP_0117443628 /NCGR_PEP_ID=MMETSP0759-20121206/4796_1 /TAXON_ID=63605 /ORGANISM="Percolomonas cosmopolitus, Strain WS" /LENGTH=831 /DNA_ID=CAMNT_0005235615 /DNA_START=130 /DNA_END=2622 /DNA_ORIENTATION=-